MTANESDVFVLNPFFRLRKEEGFITVFGAHGMGTWSLHLSHGIVLALCDGERTLQDIARMTRPFVAVEDDEVAIQTASQIVTATVNRMALTKTEQKGEEAGPSRFPSEAAVLKKEEYGAKFGSTKFPRPRYRARDFLPQEASEIREYPFSTVHYRSPHNVTWHLTSECSTDCRYCYLMRRDVRPLPKDKALALVREMADADVCMLELSGGDLLLYPHLLDVLAEMRQAGFPPIVISTKSYLSRERAAELASASDMILEVQFSIDSDDTDVAQYLVRVPDYPKRIFSSIDNALEAGLEVCAKVVITPYNILTVPRLYRKLKERGVSEIRLATYGRSGYHHTDDLFVNPHCYTWLDEEIKKLRKEYPDTHLNIQNGAPQLGSRSREARQMDWASRSACTAGSSSMMICADGKVIPCEQMPETEEYFCGDLTQQSLLEVWNGSRLKEMTYGMPQERFKGQVCYDCDEREDCLNVKGNCIRDLAVHYGNIYRPAPNCYRHDLPIVRTI